MNLDDKKVFEKLDRHQVAKSIELLPDQMRQVLESARLVKIPKEYKNVENVVLAGMGGSNLGIRIVRHLFSEQIKKPINICAGYSVPNYVSKITLYIISSYSGTTEEPLSTYKEAKKRNAKIVAITEDSSKSKLKKIMIKDNLPGFVFKPDFNPSNQPRLGLGYSVFGIAVILAKAGLIKIDTKEMQIIIDKLELASRKWRVDSPSSRNLAKKVVSQLEDTSPILVGAEHLSGNLHVLRNQINECAKTYSSYLMIPDMNHYAMEGLVKPDTNKENLTLVFFDSDLYDKRVAKRVQLTKQVAKKNKLKVVSVKLKGESKREQCFEMLQLGSWLAYYLGIMYEFDPVAIPYVDWFKNNLK